ncbi:aado keto reductase [Moniliophthora roreri MCA 2997]|uniref:Aado keto reductase n=1 Tax=Moniliophthora roreri (strain MCA 2997) TaxID=1381753 RepID=V2WWY1_MONRO|nr:aado keto reductase [Moniliophthora roreri MCA 2997]
MSSAAARVLKLSNGIEIPIVGLGTWAPPEGTAREDAKEWILTGLKAGYRHLDGAHMYGTEKAVSKAIKASGLKREEIFVTTKIPWNHHSRVQESINESLANLDLEYVDLWLLHWPQTLAYEEGTLFLQNPDGTLKTVDYPTFVEVWAEMEKAFEQGKCKAIGVSNFSIKNLEILLKTAKVIPVNNQVEMHPYLQQNELKEYCEKRGISISAYTPSGWDVVRGDPTIVEIAKKHGVSPHQVILAWHLARDTIVITKSSNEQRQKNNLILPTLSEEDIQKINALDRGQRFCNTADKHGHVWGWTYEQLGW